MLFKRKEIWVPTWKGWLAIFLAAAALIIGGIRFTAPFLAPTKPVGAPILVVEGWISEDGLLHAIELDKKNHYSVVIAAGQNIEKGMDISHYENYANLAASRLVALGFKGTNIVKIAAPKSKKDRTYHTALEVRKFLLTKTEYRSIDIISDSVHARRSWYLYRYACEPEIKVGIIAATSPQFDADHWWRTSNGVRIVLNEAIAYLYAKLVFNPE
jgi:hypothetical protein